MTVQYDSIGADPRYLKILTEHVRKAQKAAKGDPEKTERLVWLWSQKNKALRRAIIGVGIGFMVHAEYMKPDAQKESAQAAPKLNLGKLKLN